jgi:hypothetical protein
MELGVGGAPDFAHAAFAQLGGDSVMGDGLRRTHRVIPGIVSLSMAFRIAGRVTGAR